MEAKSSRFNVSHPGFFVTFKEQAEVYELLVKDEIHQVIFHLCKDRSFRDERESRSSTSGEAPMKKPYLISGYEINQALGNKLFPRVYDIEQVT